MRYSVSWIDSVRMTFSSRTSFRSTDIRFPPFLRLASWRATCFSPKLFESCLSSSSMAATPPDMSDTSSLRGLRLGNLA